MERKKNTRVKIAAFICCLMAAVMTVSAIEIFASSFIKLSTSNHTYSTYISYGDRTKVKFEDSELFAVVLNDTIDDVTRMCVIRDQMETNGKYDSNKKIDITAYANRTKLVDDTTVTANYRLDDLIKWGRYGYDFEIVTGSKAELDTYFEALSSGDKVSSDSDMIVHVNDYSNDAKLSSVISPYISDAQKNKLAENNGYYSMYVLLDKYKSADGKTLASYASNRSEYEALVLNLCSSANDLFSNYGEYSEYNKLYVSGVSNIRYCYQISDGKGNIRKYYNLDEDLTALTNDEISKVFMDYSKYICFNPDKLQMASSVNEIGAIQISDSVEHYRYIFGDGSRIWIAVDNELAANDSFKYAKEAYTQKNMSFIPALLVFGISFLLAILMLVLMTCWSGISEVEGEDGRKKKIFKAAKIDRIPIELYLIALAMIVVLIFVVCGTTAKALAYDYDSLITNITFFKCIFAVEIFVAAMLLCALYLILVRKIKGKLIWETSILKWLFSKTKNGILDAYDNGQLLVRTWLPYLIFLCINLILVLLGRKATLLAFIMDMAVGGVIYYQARQRNEITEGINKIANGNTKYKLDTKSMHGDNLALAKAVNSIGDGISAAVEKSMKDERMKADLITNVSHDIKTPLTSIINYVDLLKRENIEDEKISGYIDVLDQKSQRLKDLTNDLVEASKISSGNISLNLEKINMLELINQSVGEFYEKFEERGLKVLINKPENPIFVMTDSRGVFRVVENLFNNIYKYSLQGTRVYIDFMEGEKEASFSVKNISAEELNISANELTERFVRGDMSRRKEGSGLGLSIAKSLVEAMNGSFDISLDGDLFKVTVTFEKCN